MSAVAIAERRLAAHAVHRIRAGKRVGDNACSVQSAVNVCFMHRNSRARHGHRIRVDALAARGAHQVIRCEAPLCLEQGADLQHRRVRRVGAPRCDSDAANRHYVHHAIDGAIACARRDVVVLQQAPVCCCGASTAGESLAVDQFPALSAAASAHVGLPSGGGGRFVTSAAPLRHTPPYSTQNIVAAVGAADEWSVDFAPGSVLDANGLARARLVLTRGQSVALMHLGDGRFALLYAGCRLE